jgi:plasmid stability protein
VRGGNCGLKPWQSAAAAAVDVSAIDDYFDSMSSITIRNLDPSLKEKLRVRAAEHGHSMEAEARRIMQHALAGGAPRHERNLYERIHARFARLGGIDLEVPPREPAREPPRFD